MKLASTRFQDSQPHRQGGRERKTDMVTDRGREGAQGSWNSDVHLRNMGKGGDIIGRWQRGRVLIR